MSVASAKCKILDQMQVFLMEWTHRAGAGKVVNDILLMWGQQIGKNKIK